MTALQKDNLNPERFLKNHRREGVKIYYSISLSFRMYISLLTPFDTGDWYYFRLNLSQVLLIKVLFIKMHA